MLLQCPDCGRRGRPKPPAGTEPGTKVVVTCKCGTRLRFTMPGTPKPPAPKLPDLTDFQRDVFGTIFGGGRK